jgi:nucleoside-diphosphate-sugar epimerase
VCLMNLEGKKILITGADGFFGCYLAERLVLDRACVRGLCCYNSYCFKSCCYTSQGNSGWQETVASEIHTGLDVQLDHMRDSRFTDRDWKHPEIVFHLAAQYV